jgi:hypothetical protein
MRGEGSPAGSGSITASAIGLMESVKEQAATMISSIKVSNGVMAGRRLEYQSTDPEWLK